ncbi:MAG: ATP-grasp domain-containing protein [Acidobacteria bacterium]|nr:ATP-grasp domain-containing protein [Acidobacteriota bacterium]
MKRVLLLTTATGYQTRSFGDAAARLGIELVFWLDRCRGLADPWGDRSLVVRYYDDDRSLETIVGAASEGPIDGVIALGDQPTVLAGRAAEAIGLPFHPPDAARICRNKREGRQRLQSAGLPVPAFQCVDVEASPHEVAGRLTYPVVVKPLGLSGSRGVIRADDPAGFVRAFARVQHILRAPDIRPMKDPAHRHILIESFIPGTEFAVEGVMQHGELHVLAIFDKPDPLEGPFFEETIYVTPSRAADGDVHRIVAGVTAAASAFGLRHGPIHAECRLNAAGVFVLEIGARPIGGLCARSLRFEDAATRAARSAIRRAGCGGDAPIPFEELLLRHAIGEDVGGWVRESRASGVMMVPIPHAGVYRGVDGVQAACRVTGIDEVLITAKPDQHLVPLPEGASYLGFIFAHAATAAAAVGALRAAHHALRFRIDRELPMAKAPFA